MRACAWIPALLALVALTACGDDEEEQAAPTVPALEGLAVERIDPDSVRITWTAVAGQVEVREATVAADAPAGEVVAEVDGASEAVIDGLDPTQRWYFAVSQKGGPARVTAERHVPLAGAFNFRDIGGYEAEGGKHVRWGLAFRSDALANITPEDQALLAGMGLRTIVDLRSAPEVQNAPDKPVEGATRVEGGIVLPINPQEVCASQEPVSTFIDAAYIAIIDSNAAVLADLTKRYSDVAQQPVLTHCSAGKERTGIAIGLLLSLVGVPDEQVAYDYSLSSMYLEQIAEKQRQVLQSFGCSDARIDEILAATPASIETVLDHVRSTYGSVEEYLKGGGLTDADIARLHDSLLE
jgi:protein-tyrosine phosphatase